MAMGGLAWANNSPSRILIIPPLIGVYFGNCRCVQLSAMGARATSRWLDAQVLQGISGSDHVSSLALPSVDRGHK